MKKRTPARIAAALVFGVVGCSALVALLRWDMKREKDYSASLAGMDIGEAISFLKERFPPEMPTAPYRRAETLTRGADKLKWDLSFQDMSKYASIRPEEVRKHYEFQGCRIYCFNGVVSGVSTKDETGVYFGIISDAVTGRVEFYTKDTLMENDYVRMCGVRMGVFVYPVLGAARSVKLTRPVSLSGR